MPNVKIIGRDGVLRSIDEGLIKRFSQTAREQISVNNKLVNVVNAAPEAVHYVLKHVDKCPRDLKIVIGRGLKVAQAIAVYEAIHVLKIQPSQGHIVQYLVRSIANKKLEMADIGPIVKIFGPGTIGEGEKVWATAINHLA